MVNETVPPQVTRLRKGTGLYARETMLKIWDHRNFNYFGGLWACLLEFMKDFGRGGLKLKRFDSTFLTGGYVGNKH